MKNMTMVKIQSKLIVAIFFSQFLFLFSFGNLFGLEITIPFLLMTIYIIFSMVSIIVGSIKIDRARFFFFVIIALTAFLSCFLSPFRSNFNSLFLFLFYFLLFVLIDCRITDMELSNFLNYFLLFITIFSLFGIYQFFAYNFVPSLPFKEIVPKIFWTAGYNTLQTTHNSLFGFRIVKPHSIYTEASNLSKFSAIGIMLALNKNIDCKLFGRKLSVIINIMTLFLSLSGSGFIILFVLLIFRMLTVQRDKKIVYIFSLFAIFLFFSILKKTEIGSYYFDRINEFGGTNTSAYYRFILPFYIGTQNIFENFFGFGIGNDDIALQLYHAGESSIGNGFGKIFVEMGIFGLFEIIFLFVFIFKPKNNMKINVFFFIIIILFNIVGSYMTPIFWCNGIMLIACNQFKKKEDLSNEH